MHRRFSRLSSAGLIAAALALQACFGGGGSSSQPASTPSGPQAVTPASGPAGQNLSYFEAAFAPGQVFATFSKTGPQTWTVVDAAGESAEMNQVDASANHVEIYNPHSEQWWKVDLVNNEVQIGDQGSAEAITTLLLLSQRFG